MFTAQKVCTSNTVWVEFCHDYYMNLWVTPPQMQPLCRNSHSVPPLKNALLHVPNLC